MRTSLLMTLVTLVWVAGCAMPPQSAALEAAGPKPDARFQVTTTAIFRGMGLSWGNGRLGDNYIDYKFRVEALTLNEWNDRFAVSGQQVTLYGNVYPLVHVPDFAGTYTEATPAVTSAVGGSNAVAYTRKTKGSSCAPPGALCLGPSACGRISTCACSRIISQSRSEIFKGDSPSLSTVGCTGLLEPESGLADEAPAS